MPDNTEQSWGETLLALAVEAEQDADQRDSSLNLHTTLKDFAKVARAYASRLSITAVPAARSDRLVAAMDAARDAVGSAPKADAMLDVAEALRAEMRAFEERVDAKLAALNTLGQTDIPRWIIDTLEDHHRRISALEQRANFSDFIAPADMIPDEYVEINPAAWESIEVARKSLRTLLAREYRNKTASRLNLLSRIAALSNIAIRDESQEAELRQYQSWVVSEEKIEAVYGAKRDEIEALDDLAVARGYDVKAGWP